MASDAQSTANCDDPAEPDRSRQELFETCGPVGGANEIPVDRIAQSGWKRQRAERVEAAIAKTGKADSLPLHSRTPLEWGRAVLADPTSLLIDHAFLEKKAANNALELLTRWPGDWVDGWVEIMTSVARDESAHLAQVIRILARRGARLSRVHKNPYANSLRLLVRKGEAVETLDRLLVSALIELRSCERFSVLASVAADQELAQFYQSLYSSERGHYTVFLKLASEIDGSGSAGIRWTELLAAEARILAGQPPGPRIHSGLP
jgi:tRNA-(ms[2]io[6]A)-hydroxylase